MDFRIGSWSRKRATGTYSLPARTRSLLTALFLSAALLAGTPAESQQSGRNEGIGAAGAHVAGADSRQEQMLQRINAAGTIRESRAMLEELVQTAEDGETRQRAHELIAELAELSREYRLAQQHYRLAWEAGEASSRLDLLLSSASLRLELGETSAALEETDIVIATAAADPSLQINARLLRARLLLAEGNRTEAAAEVSSLQREVLENGNASQAFLLYELGRNLEDSHIATAAGSTLRDRHPDSIEYALIRQDIDPANRRVHRYPSPTNLLTLHSPVEEQRLPDPPPGVEGDQPPAPESASEESVLRDRPSTDTRTVRAIQTGAFRDPENASYMARDISNAGFPAEVRERGGEDAPVYVVQVPLDAGTSRDRALERMTALKEVGIEGFLIYD